MLEKQDYGNQLCMFVNYNFQIPYFSPSSAEEFHFREMEYGTTSVMENSLTLNAGDKIAHWERK